jgi:hypothetical protein
VSETQRTDPAPTGAHATPTNELLAKVYRAVIEAYDDDEQDYSVYDASPLFASRASAEKALAHLNRPYLNDEELIEQVQQIEVLP